MNLSTKDQADEAVQQKDWEKAARLYLEVLESLPDDSSKNSLTLHAKLHTNLSFVYLKKEQYEDAMKHGDHAVALAQDWGKAYARLGAAQQAGGLLLDAADSYRSAFTATEPFHGCKNVYQKLLQSPRFLKLQLIQRAKQEEPIQLKNRVGKVISTPDEENDPYNAINAMNAKQKELLAMIRAGRVLPESTMASNERLVKEQDLILYLAALDASILLHVPHDARLLCPGTRAWIIANGRRQTPDYGILPDSATSFDVYKTLFDFEQQQDEFTTEVEKFWNHDESNESYKSSTILFCPNRDCDNGRSWGPTVKFMLSRIGKIFPDDGREALIEGTFLVGLNHWLMVQAGTDVFPMDWEQLSMGAFAWDKTKQQLVNHNANHPFKPEIFYSVAGIVAMYFSSWQWEGAKIPLDLFWHREF